MSLQYALCTQTVTVYNTYKDEANQQHYVRTILEKAARMDFKRQWQEGKTGTTGGTSCLLVIPQGAAGKTFVMPNEYAAKADKTGYFTLKNGDKVQAGIGPEIATVEQWGQYIPALVDGLVEIESVDPKYSLFTNEIVHVEAGGQ